MRRPDAKKLPHRGHQVGPAGILRTLVASTW